MTKQEQLDNIKSQIINNSVCENLAKGANNLVFGSGNPDADIVLIGEAPGKKEDEQGVPFVGAAGKFLDEMLEEIHLNREQIYITNIVKYRPPNNRDPEPNEKSDFWPYLVEQIKVIKPKLIVTLGRHPMSGFLPESKISEVHGQPKRITVSVDGKNSMKLIILPLYHPAAALYNGGMRNTLKEDFKNITITINKVNKG